jgi:heat shock protein HslJ
MEALGNVASYAIESDTLTLKDKEGNIIAVLKKMN